tara:strand:- start:444 stop:929 length:486 start_codon:yes stop_codon:yes gene_type:complete
MPLIIEDGSVVANANSYTTDAEFIAYAAAKGLDIPATESGRDILQLKGAEYILANEECMQGQRVNRDQTMSFPRYNVYLYGFLVPSNEIPQTLKTAQMEAAIVSQTVDLLPNSAYQNVQREKLDSLEKAYFSNGKRVQMDVRTVNAYLWPLFQDMNRLVRT